MKRALGLGLFGMMAVACASTADESTSDTSAASTASPTLECPSLGTNETTFLSSKGDTITITVEGASTQTGSKVTDADAAAAGFTAYGNWSPAKGFMKDQILWVKGNDIQMHQPNVGPFWPSTCKAASAADLSADHCEPLVSELSFFDTSKKPTIKKSGSDYTIMYTNASIGNLVWKMPTTTKDLLCTVGDPVAVSCAAIVADAIGQQAFKDGSSSGQPYITSHSAAKGYVGGVHDEESGEFSYVIQTDSTNDGCKVTSIVSTSNNQ